MKSRIFGEITAARLDASTIRDGSIMALWRMGLNTREIASKLGELRESAVANRLAVLRDAGRP